MLPDTEEDYLCLSVVVFHEENLILPSAATQMAVPIEPL